MPKAKLIAQLFEPLDERRGGAGRGADPGRAGREDLPQVERLAWRAALAVAPDVAERRRATGERRARVTVFREESGAVGLSGRDLPAAEALAGHANVLARARRVPGVGGVRRPAQQQPAGAGLPDLLNGVSARERIAFAASAGRGTARRPPARMTGTATVTAPVTGDGPGPSGGRAGRQPRPGAELPGGPGRRRRHESRRRRPARTSRATATAARRAGRPPAPASPLAEVTVPLATLQAPRGTRRGQPAARPARPRPGPRPRRRSGPLTRLPLGTHHRRRARLRRSATASPAPPAAQARQPQPPPARHAPRALPARVTITITETLLHQLETQAAAQPRSGAPTRRLGTHPKQTRNLDTHPARRPAADRPARRRAHVRLRPPVPGQLLPARRPAAPPGPGPRPRVHLAALLPARPRVGLRARCAMRCIVV